MKWILTVLASLFMISCNKIPYDQYYIFENPTNDTLVLYMNPPAGLEQNYYIFNPSTYADKIWPPMVTTILEPYGRYTLHGTMVCDYYDVWFSVWKFPAKEGDKAYWSSKINYTNSIPTK